MRIVLNDDYSPVEGRDITLCWTFINTEMRLNDGNNNYIYYTSIVWIDTNFTGPLTGSVTGWSELGRILRDKKLY